MYKNFIQEQSQVNTMRKAKLTTVGNVNLKYLVEQNDEMYLFKCLDRGQSQSTKSRNEVVQRNDDEVESSITS